MLLIIATTNRKNSKTYRVAEYYQRLLREQGATSEIMSLEQLPPDFAFTALYDNSGKNEEFNLLKQTIEDAEKIAFIVPEYNGSFPGVLKSFIDGLGWPNALKGKKAALVGLSDGSMGGAHALSHLTDVLHYLNCHVLSQLVRIPFAKKVFYEGEVHDELIASLLSEQARQLMEF